MFWAVVLIFPIVCIIRFWLICITKCDEHLKRTFKEDDKVLVLIAHPDDECMFFGPT